MYRVTWGRSRAYLRALKQKMREPLVGAIFDEHDQKWYQNNQSMILQQLVRVAKPYRKYRAKNRFSLFHPFLKSNLRSKIVRISLKFGQWCKIGQIIDKKLVDFTNGAFEVIYNNFLSKKFYKWFIYILYK